MTEWQSDEQVPGMVRAILRTGIVETRKQAETILFGIAIACVLVSVWLLFGDTHTLPRPEDELKYEPPYVTR